TAHSTNVNKRNTCTTLLRSSASSKRTRAQTIKKAMRERDCPQATGRALVSVASGTKAAADSELTSDAIVNTRRARPTGVDIAVRRTAGRVTATIINTPMRKNWSSL